MKIKIRVIDNNTGSDLGEFEVNAELSVSKPEDIPADDFFLDCPGFIDICTQSLIHDGYLKTHGGLPVALHCNIDDGRYEWLWQGLLGQFTEEEDWQIIEHPSLGAFG